MHRLSQSAPSRSTTKAGAEGDYSPSRWDSRSRCSAPGAEQRRAGLGPLHVEVHVVLPRVADAAQALDALGGDELLAVTHTGLGHGDGHVAPLVGLGDGRRREVRRGPGRLHRHVHVGQLVLDGLERARPSPRTARALGHRRARCRRWPGTSPPSRWRAPRWPPGRRRCRTGPARAGISEHAVGLDAHRVEDDTSRSSGWRRGRPWARSRSESRGTTNRPIPSSPALPGRRAATTTSAATSASKTKCFSPSRT